MVFREVHCGEQTATACAAGRKRSIMTPPSPRAPAVSTTRRAPTSLSSHAAAVHGEAAVRQGERVREPRLLPHGRRDRDDRLLLPLGLVPRHGRPRAAGSDALGVTRAVLPSERHAASRRASGLPVPDCTPVQSAPAPPPWRRTDRSGAARLMRLFASAMTSDTSGRRLLLPPSFHHLQATLLQSQCH
ncbi:hypothetical protein GUJ93_ZPchr0005g15142 [Zizania palustris]|uniref:Uncharacterized protein n=1 Tax=Zizania palustris TaxID=103762 RepID=A0A8J5VQZ0_ZIZPA|nr:hypothetical protein GUJ93_ZPchr0005g15142 [Zizania palustris]